MDNIEGWKKSLLIGLEHAYPDDFICTADPSIDIYILTYRITSKNDKFDGLYFLYFEQKKKKMFQNDKTIAIDNNGDY